VSHDQQGPAGPDDPQTTTIDGFAPDAALLAQGAVEAYTATYTDGTSADDTVLTDWPSEEQGQPWAAPQDARFTPSSSWTRASSPTASRSTGCTRSTA